MFDGSTVMIVLRVAVIVKEVDVFTVMWSSSDGDEYGVGDALEMVWVMCW